MSTPDAVPPVPGNYVSEWFGHRIYPMVADPANARADQQHQRCPFLTEVTGAHYACVKAPASRGVCTISSLHEGRRYDWLVCPFRALDYDILGSAARRLFGHSQSADMLLEAATNLEAPESADAFRHAVHANTPSVVYFQNKLGGEITLTKTARSPRLNFDVTMVEVFPGTTAGQLQLGRYGIFEVQTMDYHGGYGRAVDNLSHALHLHKDDFGAAVANHPEWAGENIETPNVANVFKRTFYQMMFKFQIGGHGRSAGCIFAIPRAVWESWQPYLGAPDLVDHHDGTWRLQVETAAVAEHPPAWIYVFDTVQSANESPNRLSLWRVIGTSADALAHYALDVAPTAAVEEGGSADRLLETLRAKLLPYLPDLAST